MRVQLRPMSPLVLALAVAGVLTAAAAGAQIRIQDRVVAGADAARRGFQERDFPRLHQVAESVYAVEDLAGAIDSNLAFTTNALFVVTPEGVVVLDAFRNVERTRALIRVIAGVTSQPIRYLVIGADHGDHTAGNQAFIDAYPDVVFITHPNAALPDAQRARVGRYVADQYVLMLGGVSFDIRFLGRAHTGSDLVVHMPQFDLLWASETFFNGLYPSPGGGRTAFPKEWYDVLQRIDAVGAGLILPNHGFIDSPATMRAVWRDWLALFDNLVSQGTALHARGVRLDGASYAIDIGRFQYWYRAANNLHTMLLRLYAELDGTLEPYAVTPRTPAVPLP